MARERAKKGGTTSTTSEGREAGEYSIRRRFVGQIDGAERVAWIELGTVEATSKRKALEGYAAQHGDAAKLDGSPLEAVSTRFRLELTPSVERQLVIKWGSS